MNSDQSIVVEQAEKIARLQRLQRAIHTAQENNTFLTGSYRNDDFVAALLLDEIRELRGRITSRIEWKVRHDGANS